MTTTSVRENIDELIKHFWMNGYMTVRRKFGTYLPEPTPIGKYDVDAVGRFKKRFALGVVLTDEELNDSKINAKLEFLATRQTKYSNKRVILFVGIHPENFSRARIAVESLSLDASRNIKLVILNEKLPSTTNTAKEDHIPNNFS
ncbi:MAG: hypothetical protein NTX22_01630 [Ignavibacteriales bacterium]|nr:hypothetical protein [Ignavibacteriales bacterium]